MGNTVSSLIAKPLSVAGQTVTAAHIARVIDELADVPESFIAMDLMGPLPDHGVHWKQEVMNRLCQRWRKLGLMSFKGGYWRLSRGAWDMLQTAARAVPVPHA